MFREWKMKKDEREHTSCLCKSWQCPSSAEKNYSTNECLRKKNGLELLDEAKRVPKTRKNQDPDTHSDLYTDEDPRGTIHGLGFKDVETAEASVRKIKASDRTHWPTRFRLDCDGATSQSNEENCGGCCVS